MTSNSNQRLSSLQDKDLTDTSDKTNQTSTKESKSPPIRLQKAVEFNKLSEFLCNTAVPNSLNVNKYEMESLYSHLLLMHSGNLFIF